MGLWPVGGDHKSDALVWVVVLSEQGRAAKRSGETEEAL